MARGHATARQGGPHFEAPCFFTVDPDCRLVTSHFQEGLPEIPSDWLLREYVDDDYNSMTAVLASPTGIGTLHDATRGRPDLSTKYHVEMRPFGCEQELVVALRASDGTAWGSIGLYRETGRPLFSAGEQRVLAAVAPILADGVRHSLLSAQAAEPDLPRSPGVVVLEGRHTLSATGTVAQWLADLGGDVETLPTPVLAAAGQVLAGPPGPDVTLRVRATSGRWIAVHAGRLDDGTGRDRVSVVIDAARPEQVESILMQAHGLTPRERDVTGAVLRGLATREIAAELSMAAQTVQQHLKSVFDKTGVRTRRELVADVFRGHFVPRVRDNEDRSRITRPSRGGPFPTPPS